MTYIVEDHENEKYVTTIQPNGYDPSSDPLQSPSSPCILLDVAVAVTKKKLIQQKVPEAPLAPLRDKVAEKEITIELFSCVRAVSDGQQEEKFMPESVNKCVTVVIEPRQGGKPHGILDIHQTLLLKASEQHCRGVFTDSDSSSSPRDTRQISKF